ncbi:putative hexose phosphate transport protein [Chloropicon roscoffensis]|uniref:Hexose phosphate transport protein n=1 Tax=Chloropicon roscoffensis TaxID=1461544 RepID=A0A7S3C700_9CHLO|mmetsp:Transcript_10380/g.31727  ORF Transcript_10380/g.31727 Transcript_10380/m.31727 type:complete len:538 (+) Transcript_10380:76-1689(+)
MATVPSAMVATRSAPASAGRARRPALSARAARSGPQPQRGSRGRARSNWPEPSVVVASRRACLGLERRAFGRKGPIVVARAAETPDVKGKSSNQPASFFRVRLFTFIGILVGYSCYYLTRNSLTYTAPVMVASKDLGLDVSSIGAMTSIFPIAYGMSKFVSGVLGSMMSASRLLGLGLICTGLINVCFGFGSSLAWFCTLWAMNGILQGVGGPCCARILTSWFATEERGTYWGMWNIAHNLGGFMAPLLAGSAAATLGWKWGMWAPGMIGVVVGFILVLGVKDKPETAGFQPVEDPGESNESSQGDGDGEEVPESKQSIKQILFDNVLRNPFIWGMAFTYFFVYVIRQGVTSWFVFYLLQEKGATDAGIAAQRVSGLELGGLVGSLLAGRLSDLYIARSKGKGGIVGKRVQVVIAYTIGVALMLLAFRGVPASWATGQWLCIFMIGFFLYGPQMLIGLCGAELVGPASVGASEGFLGWIAYLGAANAGVPLSIIVRDYGWNAYFTTLLAACAGALLLLAPMTNLKSFTQRKEAKKLK